MNKKVGKREVEALGFVGQEKHNELKKVFSKKYGKPELVKRLSISFWDPSINKKLDTRIRITNGEPEVMQKYGDWEDRVDMQVDELSFPLRKNAKDIYSAYKIIKRIKNSNYPARFIQFDNMIFDCRDFEIKLVKQFGGDKKYLFEIELINNALNLKTILEELKLSKYVKKTNVTFWEKWNNEVNLDDKSLSESEIMRLIKKYL